MCHSTMSLSWVFVLYIWVIKMHQNERKWDKKQSIYKQFAGEISKQDKNITIMLEREEGREGEGGGERVRD